MTKVPSVEYKRVVKALQRDGWVVVRQRGSHIRLQKHIHEETLKLTVQPELCFGCAKHQFFIR